MNWTVCDDYLEAPKQGSNDYMGFVYAVEYGEDVKIGCTSELKSRISALKSQAEKYADKKLGKFVYSPEHTNYRENEKILHLHFQSNRCGKSELFKITLDEFLEELPDLNYLDESLMKEKRACEFAEGMKKFILNGNTDVQEYLKTAKTKHDYMCAAVLISKSDTDELLEFTLRLLRNNGFDLPD